MHRATGAPAFSLIPSTKKLFQFVMYLLENHTTCMFNYINCNTIVLSKPKSALIENNILTQTIYQ